MKKGPFSIVIVCIVTVFLTKRASHRPSPPLNVTPRRSFPISFFFPNKASLSALSPLEGHHQPAGRRTRVTTGSVPLLHAGRGTGSGSWVRASACLLPGKVGAAWGGGKGVQEGLVHACCLVYSCRNPFTTGLMGTALFASPSGHATKFPPWSGVWVRVLGLSPRADSHMHLLLRTVP